jgi:signal transduction histidine kinase
VVTNARASIDALIDKALALPGDLYEKNQLGKLQANVRAFDEAAERAMAEARAGQAQAARDTLLQEARPEGDAAVAIAKNLVDYDAQLAEKAAMRIEAERTRANRVAYQLDALSALLAMAAALLALRVIRQVHSVQEAHQRLVEDKAEELEQFAGRVAHDVLSPLTSVGLALTVAARSAPSAHEAVARGNSALQRVRGLVDGLLEFARAGARPDALARTEVGPVVAGLRDELAPFAAEHAAVLHLEPPPRCSVPCSPGVLLSLIGNLLRNAIKYLGPAQVREVSLRVRLRRGRVLFEVEDTGPGIPASLTERVFEPYVRGPNSDVPGMGLGLATVKRLVVSHGGTVGVRAGAEGGAIFWFELAEAPGVENVARSD